MTATLIRWSCLVALAAPLPALADALEGEWALDEAQCAEMRVTYTADGRHEALVAGEDGWTVLSSGRWRRDGDRIEVSAEGSRETLLVVRLDARVLELRNADAERMRALGSETVRFVRCPAR